MMVAFNNKKHARYINSVDNLMTTYFLYNYNVNNNNNVINNNNDINFDNSNDLWIIMFDIVCKQMPLLLLMIGPNH